MAGGRPKDSLDRLPKGWQAKMKELARDGASDIELRVELGISDALWYRWIDEDEEFSGAVKECKQLCQMWWERTGRKMAGGEADGNATVWIFNMKNRFNWRDKQDVEHSGQVDLSSKTDDELKARAAKLLAKVEGE